MENTPLSFLQTSARCIFHKSAAKWMSRYFTLVTYSTATQLQWPHSDKNLRTPSRSGTIELETLSMTTTCLRSARKLFKSSKKWPLMPVLYSLTNNSSWLTVPNALTTPKREHASWLFCNAYHNGTTLSLYVRTHYTSLYIVATTVNPHCFLLI